MGVQDSLVDGISFFMAELQRIKQIVNLTIEEHKQGRTVVFLLDEILQGTNTVERREIVQRVIAHLVSNQAIGAVTTHDLALAESEELTKNADLIHFREHFERDSNGKPKMTFDYKIRPGVATTTNALKILEVIEMPV
jgi:DNA mismatch repair ATPase MutS